MESYFLPCSSCHTGKQWHFFFPQGEERTEHQSQDLGYAECLLYHRVMSPAPQLLSDFYNWPEEAGSE